MRTCLQKATRFVMIVMLTYARGTAIAQGSDDSSQRTTALRVTETIRVDGLLDELAWRRASAILLRQRDPLEDADPSEETEVLVAYDADALYVAVICHDRTPSAIVSTQLTRDANLDVDDHVTIILDPFFDQRNGYFFQVNPSGARTDGQISNNAKSLPREWDGIWNAKARITDAGWQAEIEIPFKTLRFKPGQTVWGLNVERHIKRRQENDRWASPRRNIWVGNLAAAGRLEGLEGIRQGLGVDIRPYVSGGDENLSGQFVGGLDIFQNLSSNLNAALTVNTDFAETEADIRQVNLTRFPLFFPEKRAFFLEGAGVFDVAGLTTTNDVRPFFSRRIGLLEDIAIPIRAGVKLTGHLSKYNIGVLDVETGSRRDGLSHGGVGPQNLLAARVSRNVLQQSSIGGIVVRGNPDGKGDNTLVGMDLHLATSTFRGDKNVTFEVYGLRTDDGASGKQDGVSGFRLDYPNDLWDVTLNWKHIGEGFRPALGFVPRAGIRKADLGIGFQPRPQRWGFRQFSFQLIPSYVTNLQNRVENWRMFTSPFNVQTESGEHLEWDYTPEFEHLDAPFEIAPGLVVPPGSYQWTRDRIAVNTASKRLWVVDFAWWWGGFYAGSRRQTELGVTLKPNSHVALSVRSERNDIALPQGAFYTQVVTFRADYSFTANISWANLAQYENQTRIMGIQSRFRWILKPGSDFFLVLNRGWYNTFAGTFQPSFDRGSAKFQYTFRL